MTTDLNKELDYGPLVEALIEKTLQGKLQWMETADEETFLAAIKGERTITIQRDWGKEAGESFFLVKVHGVDGKEAFSFSSGTDPMFNNLDRLYDLAMRQARRVDENIEGTLQLLNDL
jgi:hypothetical protein